MRIAFCVIVKPTNEEAMLLNRLLNNVSRHVDGLFVTITGNNAKCEEIANWHNAHISHYEWDFNFAKARNFNFSQVPKEYTHILWGDADDMFRGLEKLRKVIEKNPNTDGFIMNYLYAWDEYRNPVVVHLKTQIVKNNGCVVWDERSWLHEDFKSVRFIDLKMTTDIERLHITDDDRVNENRVRNVEISKRMAKAYPNDPRSYWNLGNSLWGAGFLEEAMSSFSKFLGLSESDDEKYIVHLRMAQIELERKNYAMAVDHVRYAIGTKPEYPDAYNLQGHLYFAMGNYTGARDSFQKGLQKKPPVLSIVVYNPRDYDYVPLMSLAKTYYKLDLPQLAIPCLEACQKIVPNNPEITNWLEELKKEKKTADKVLHHVAKLKNITDKEKLRKELDKIPYEFKAAPLVCHIRNTNFVKETSSGKDLVFFCAYTKEEWTPETAEKKGIGGSEEAIINLSKRLAHKGWDVVVYNNCGYRQLEFDGVKWRPYWMWNPRDRQDIVVLWRHPKPVDFNVNAEKVYLDLHDVVSEGELYQERLEKVEKIFVKSKAQRNLYPNVPDEKFLIIPNGVDLRYFEREVERDPYLLVNFSSPDRFLESALDILPEVIKRLPKDIAKRVKFEWHYGWTVFDSAHTSEKAQEWKVKIMQKFEELKREGIVNGGERVNHAKVAELNLRAGALIYPSEFYEIDWVGGTKALVAGCIPITTDFAATGEKIASYGIRAHSKRTIEDWDKIDGYNFGITDPETREDFIQNLVRYLENPHQYDQKRAEMALYAREKYDWDRITEIWNEELSKGRIINQKPDEYAKIPSA